MQELIGCVMVFIKAILP